MGQFQFYVDFPTKVSTPKAISTTKKKKLTSLTSSKTKNKQMIEDDATSSGYSSKKTRNRTSISKKKKLLSFVNLEDDDDDDSDEFVELISGGSITNVGGKAKSPSTDRSILPKNHTEILMKRIKKLVTMWADEEIMNGNKVFCKCMCVRFKEEITSTSRFESYYIFPIFI